MSGERDEECELTHLVPPDNEGHLSIKTGEVTPPVTPSICKVAATPSSPTSNKVSSSGGGSIHGTGGTSQGSLCSRSKLPGPSLTPIGLSSGNSRFLYVSEKLSNISRRPSLLSDASARTQKETKSANTRMTSMKKELESLSNSGDSPALSAPPNTPSPSGWRNQPPDANKFKNNLSLVSEGSFLPSEASSKYTTKALASESDNTLDSKTSSETLQKLDRPPRPLIPLDSNFSSSVGNLGSNNALNWAEHLNYLKATRSGHTGLRSVGSSAFIKSFWGYNRNQKNIQHHCFMSDITDVRQMEQALLQLLEDFHSGKLRAFAKDCSMEQMQGIREQQERLAKLHFDLGAQQELYAPLSEEGLRANQENMHKLMGSLEQLSLSIEKLQLFSKDVSQ